MMYSRTSLPQDLMAPSHFTGLDAHLNSLDSKERASFLCNEPLKVLVRQKAISPNDVFYSGNLMAARPA